ncbi:uncharacterized protein LOC128869678 isoform X2 [Anastrepha ludens]|uniref:uncharacterized protein LOC128869678 isoform X2 n=1 Tax=Anastrepha ludens TaxID=28586 RepID=UPI0023B19BAB|nr:uncharacterized protein LOC128869678 isoform X2 [Anastrepha ludens]
MSGVDHPNRNRFRDLDPENPPGKRLKKTETNFMYLPEHKQSDDHIPRYLVAAATSPIVEDGIRSLSKYNVFQTERGLKHISTEYTPVSELKSGDLLIKTNNLKAAEKFMKATHIGVIPVKITSHKTLNTIQGREVVEGLAKQKVVEVKKIMKKVEDILAPTGAAVITFDLICRPDTLMLGWVRVRVQEHIPNPMRCQMCQKLGHTKKLCIGVELCKECAEPPPHETCQKKFCVNCNNDRHATSDPACPSYLKHKAINKIKIENRCTVRQAWKLFNTNPSAYEIEPFQKPTTAQIVKNNITTTKNIKSLNKNNNQTAPTTSNTTISNEELSSETVQNQKNASTSITTPITTKPNTQTQNITPSSSTTTKEIEKTQTENNEIEFSSSESV